MPDRAWLEQPPPWVVFPGMAPLEAAADQGAQEAWVDQVWRPFWASLGAAERDAYLSHWGASEAWRWTKRVEISATIRTCNCSALNGDSTSTHAVSAGKPSRSA